MDIAIISKHHSLDVPHFSSILPTSLLEIFKKNFLVDAFQNYKWSQFFSCQLFTDILINSSEM